MPDGRPERLVYRERWEVVLEELRRRILTGHLTPGTVLAETDLADEFGVSRGPIRDAFRSLETVGLISREPRRQAVVSPVSLKDTEDLFAVRRSIEVLATELAVQRAHHDVAEALNVRVRAMHSAVETSASQDVFVGEDIRFHNVLYDFSANARLASVWSTMRDSVEMLMNLSVRFEPPAWDSIVEEHAAIQAAAEAGDVAGARQLVGAHLDQALERARRYVQLYMSGSPAT
jgi:GntR family transcriptional regulator of gluconate operon